MIALLPFISLPLAMATALLLTLGGHWAHKTSEQVRLDALTLSICHHRKNFMVFEIAERNLAISRIQTTMDALALPCLSPTTLIACEGVKTALEKLSFTGRRLANIQDLKRLKYFEIQRKLHDRLVLENELGEKFGALKITLPLFDGFIREQTSATHRPLEIFFGVPWPNILKPDLTFERINTIRSAFFPHRILVGANNTKWNGLTAEQKKAVNPPASVSRSQCHIEKNIHNEFLVRRSR